MSFIFSLSSYPAIYQVQYDISKEQLADFKEIFALFDKDGDGIISFTEITSALKTLGQRIPGFISIRDVFSNTQQ